MPLIETTTASAGIYKEDVYYIVFSEAIRCGGKLETKEIYEVVNKLLEKDNKTLSAQGKNSLRQLINTQAVNDGFIYKYDEKNPGWRVTPEAIRLVNERNNNKQLEIVYNEDTNQEEDYIPNVIRGAIFEKYCLGLLKNMYPYYSWFHQGELKNNERGLDLIGEKLGEAKDEYRTIGVQIKNHKSNNSPTEIEWLKFLAGCYVRKIDKAIFITTGRLTSNQRREAGEAKVNVIAGIDEVNRIAKEFDYLIFEEF